MKQEYGILILIVLTGLLSGTIWYLIKKKKTHDNVKLDYIRAAFFFFFINYFLLSAAKWYLGSPESTFLESFWDIEASTYVHYGIPLAIVAIAAPLCMGSLFRKIDAKLILLFDSSMFTALFLALLLKGVISNQVFSVIFPVCMVISLLVAVFYKKDISLIPKDEYKKSIINVLPVIGLWVIMTGVYYPNELYLNNLEEFKNPYMEFLIILVLGSLIIGVLMIGIMLLLPKAWFHCMNLILFGMGIMGYLQAMFLNGKLESLTGAEQVWTIGTQAVNIAVWLLVIGAVVVLGVKKPAVIKFYKGICIYICLIQIATLGYLIITTDTSETGKQAALTTKGSLELAEGNNVLVFVLDLFDSTVLEEIIKQDSSFVEPLSDFTYYRNATAQFGHTNTAIPYLLTGTAWQEGQGVEYIEYAYENSNAMSVIKQQGYDMGIYTADSYLTDSVCSVTSNYARTVARSSNITETMKKMLRTSMYKLVPFSFKSAAAYYSSDITEMVSTNGVWNINDDLPFYNSLVEEGLSVNENYENAFRFYHMRGPHDPFYLSEDLQYERTGREVTIYSQAKGSLKIVYEYLRQLKALGKYEDATIIITSDHGTITRYDAANNRPDVTTMPIMLVKKPNARQSALVINSAPVSQAELLPTIMEAIGLDAQEYGRTFDEISEDEERERTFVEIMEGYWKIQYVINGDAKEIENWSAESVVFE